MASQAFGVDNVFYLWIISTIGIVVIRRDLDWIFID